MDKPKVRGTVGILILRGALTLFQVFTTLGEVNSLQAQGIEFEGWFVPTLYLLLVLGVMSIVGAVLIALYKRLGLYLGGAAVGIDLLAFVLLFVTGQIALGAVGIGGVAIDLLILYYIYKYLTQEPEKLAFV